MRLRLLTLVLAILLVMPVLASVPYDIPARAESGSNVLAEDSALSITDNAGLAALSSSGDGSAGSPYIINGLRIKVNPDIFEQEGLYIENTDAYAVFFNMTISLDKSSFADDYGFGIFLRNARNLVFRRVYTWGCQEGIYARGGVNVNFTRCYFWGKGIAGEFEYTRRFTLYNCNFTRGRAGLLIRDSPFFSLLFCNLTRTGINFQGSSDMDWGYDIRGNMVNGKPLGFFHRMKNRRINGSLYGQIILSKCYRVSVERAVIRWTSLGVGFFFSALCQIKDSIIIRNFIGVKSYHSLWVRVKNCLIWWNVYGIHTWDCPWTDIGNNSIQHSEEYGIWLDAGSWGASVYLNTLDNNTISNAKDDSSVGSNGDAPPEEVNVTTTAIVEYYAYLVAFNADNTSERVSNAEVWVNYNGTWSLQGLTNANGIFNFTQHFADNFTVGIRAVGFENRFRIVNLNTIGLNPNVLFGMTPIVVPEPTEAYFHLAVMEGPEPYVNPVAGAYVRVTNGSYTKWYQTNVNGYANISELAVGVYQVKMFLGGWNNESMIVSITTLGYNGAKTLEATRAILSESMNFVDDGLGTGNFWSDYTGIGEYDVDGFNTGSKDRNPMQIGDLAPVYEWADAEQAPDTFDNETYITTNWSNTTTTTWAEIPVTTPPDTTNPNTDNDQDGTEVPLAIQFIIVIVVIWCTYAAVVHLRAKE